MWANSQFLADLVTFTEEIPNGKLHFLCSGYSFNKQRVSNLNKAWYLYSSMTYAASQKKYGIEFEPTTT